MSAPKYRVTYRTKNMHIAAEWMCAAIFATEGDARLFAADLAIRPLSDGVQVYRGATRVWEDQRCYKYRSMSMGGGR